MKAYYNEIDPYAAEWLRNLIFCGLIADGDVDTRSIEDVTPSDLKGYTQCHFFAGIGVWSYALRKAGWRDDEPVWTGSCPCQPFSAAGKRGGTTDERHLWPAWSWLIRQCKPRVVFGEQVASKDGRNWLDLVQTDLEGMGFAVGAADICAAGVGAPHIRQRLYFVADSELSCTPRLGEHGRSPENGSKMLQAVTGSGGAVPGISAHAERDAGESGRLAIEPAEGTGASRTGPHAESGRRGVPDELGNAHHQRPQGRGLRGTVGGGDGAGECATRASSVADGIVADSDGGIESDGDVQRGGEHGFVTQDGGADWLEHAESVGRIERGSESGRRGIIARRESFWSACDWLPCIDGKARSVEPGTFPLVNGASARVGRLRAYGNAIVAPCAEAFIGAYLLAKKEEEE